MNQEDCKSNGKGSQNLQNNHELHKWEHAPDCISHQPNQFAAVTRKNTHTHTHTHTYIYIMMLLETINIMCKPNEAKGTHG
jgi:hypothetical protein